MKRPSVLKLQEVQAYDLIEIFLKLPIITQISAIVKLSEFQDDINDFWLVRSR